MKYTQYKLVPLPFIGSRELAIVGASSVLGAICEAVNQNLLANGLGIHYESDPCYLQTKAEGEAYAAYRALSEHYQSLTRVVCETGEFTV